MPHIHTEAGGHDATVSAFIIRTEGAIPKLLLHRHKKLNQWLQFGGHVERTENPWQAITHELAEESGYDISQLQLLQPKVRITTLTGVLLHPVPVNSFTHKFPGLDHYHTDLSYAFLTDKLPINNISEGESTIVQAFTASELRTLLPGEIPENVREVGLFVLEVCLNEWEAVPAA